METLEYNKIKEKVNKLKSRKEYLEEELSNLKDKLASQVKRYNDACRARVILQDSAQKAQSVIETIISDIVTKSIRSVFDKEHIFKAKFVTRRNRTECDLYLELDGNKVDILEGDGGGLADIISFALRIAFWKIDNVVREKNGLKPRRGIVLADEPFKFLHSPILQEKCSNLLNELSEEFNIQMIIVSDQSNIVGEKNFVVENGEISELD